MIHSHAALDPDRLPWLTSEPATARAKAAAPAAQRSSGWSPLIVSGGAALLLVAGVSYWMGLSSQPVDRPAPQPPVETIRLPEPRTHPSTEMVRAPVPAPAPPVEVTRPEPAVTPSTPSASEKAESTPVRRAKPVRKVSRLAVRKAQPRKAAPAARRPVPVRAAPRRVVPHWPLPATALHMGRMIQLGTYSSPDRLDRAWAYRLRRYPQLRGLPKVVVPYQTGTGRTAYKLQVMTTAKGQSDWLCRKIRSDWRSCSVLRPATPRTANG